MDFGWMMLLLRPPSTEGIVDKQAARSSVRVFVDSCAVNRFALINVDPAKALAGSDFRLAVTPDLEAEYQQALRHAYVEPHVKALIDVLLVCCERAFVSEDRRPSPGGFDEDVQSAETVTLNSHQLRRNKARLHDRTDPDLIVLARTEIVITDDAKLYRRWADTISGLVPWPRVETHLKAGGDLTDLLRSATSPASAEGR